MTSTTFVAIINHLKSIFAEYGIPEILVSDNGPQYSSHDFTAFCNQWGINHVTSSPRYPRVMDVLKEWYRRSKPFSRKQKHRAKTHIWLCCHTGSPQLTQNCQLQPNWETNESTAHSCHPVVPSNAHRRMSQTTNN